MTKNLSLTEPTRVRYGVLAFAGLLSMITYLDRVCFGTVAPRIQEEFGLQDYQKGMLFSAFALAYAVFEVPSGWLGDMFGARRTLIRIVLWWSAFTALTGLIYPIAGWPAFAFLAMLAVRFLFGMGEAGAYPNIARAFHSWFPFQERGFAQGTVWMAGRFAGGVTPFIVLALMVESGDGAQKTIAWRHAFWIFGSLGVLWCIAWWWWFRDRPEQNPSVNQAERELIHGDEGPSEVSHFAVPWRKLLFSGNLWLLCVMYFCGAYGWYFNITYLPGYLEKQCGLHPGAKWSQSWWMYSLLAGAPLLLGAAACFIGGLLTDWFIRVTGNRKWGRRLFGIIGHGVCAACFFVSIFLTNPWLFVLAVALAAFWNDLTMGSAWASCLDIGKRYSGIVAGCMNTIGNLGGAVVGLVTGFILSYSLDKPAATIASAIGQTGGLPTLWQPGWVGETMIKADSLRFCWQINLFSYGFVYVVAVFCWLFFDATRPIADESVAAKPERLGTDGASIPVSQDARVQSSSDGVQSSGIPDPARYHEKS